MTNPKTDPKIRKSNSNAHSGRPAPAPERQTSASTIMIEACDRLGQKLDAFAGLFREQMEASRPSGPTTGRPFSANEPPPPVPTAQAGPIEAQSQEQRRDDAAGPPSGGGTPGPQRGGSADGGSANLAEGARGLVEALSRSGHDWQEQSANVQQALEGIMAYLENQAATAPPKVDVAGILNRLKDLEEQQQNMQSQFNTSR